MYMVHSIIINENYIIYLHRILTSSHLFSRNSFDTIPISLHENKWKGDIPSFPYFYKLIQVPIIFQLATYPESQRCV